MLVVCDFDSMRRLVGRTYVSPMLRGLWLMAVAAER
jgi:hypothetical protein